MVSADSDGTFTTANDGDGRDPDASDPDASDPDASDPGDWVDAASAANPNSRLYKCPVSRLSV
jgi:hypothetical protein